jgi:hypothetical protein
MATTKRKKTKASSTKGKTVGRQSPTGTELNAAEVAELVGEPGGRESVEALSGTAAVYAPQPARLSSSRVPLSGRVPAPEEPPPALPDMIPDPEGRVSVADQVLASAAVLNRELLANAGALASLFQPAFHTLRAGCYLLRYTPVQVAPLLNSLHYDGTLRVERSGSNTTASGDLYLHRITFPPPGSPFPFPRPVEPNPGDGIPIFARANYSYYVRVTRILEGNTTAKSFTLGFELHRFTAATNSFALEGAYTALMSWTTAPSGYPAGGDYLTGDVKNPSGATVGSVTMGWVSDALRRAVVEIDTVPGSELPVDSGAGHTWKQIFGNVGWDVTVVPSETNVAAPSGESWSDAEMHAAMLERRGPVSLDTEWRYHILCVRQIDSTPRGIMYDNGATDSNNVPREGVGIATHWMIPNTADWGKVKGMRFGAATAPFFRTALHEMGHAMGLYHNTADTGIMNTTDVISASAMPPVQFPDNIQWAHAPDDQKRLRHMPDLWVRPGGVPFGRPYSSSPISPDDMIEEPQGLAIEIAPVMNSVPIGAPVRVNFAVRNVSEHPAPAPRSLNMKAGFVKGKVIDPAGTVRTFLPVIRCLEEHDLAMLEPGQAVGNSVTLLRGPQGALFPLPGAYRVMVEVDYDLGGVTMGLTAETSVMVTATENEAHADAALRILSTPDAVLSLAIGGDHLTEGRAAIQSGLDDAVLRRHYTVIEAKRLASRFRGRKADLDAASDLMSEDAVVSPAEIRKMAKLCEGAGGAGGGRARQKMSKALEKKATEAGAGDEIVGMVRGI